FAGSRVAGRAVDVEALASALEHSVCHGEREARADGLAVTACVEQRVLAQLAAGDGARQELARSAVVLEEGALLERLVLGGVVHVLAARRDESRSADRQHECRKPATQK